MPLKEKLVSAGFATEHVPGGYQIIGDVLLVRFPPAKIRPKEKRAIAKAIAQLMPNIKTVGEIGKISGELRKPKVALLYSEKKARSFETVHVENGIKFKLDASKLMFSKGNLAERARLVSRIKPREIIIDMFAGIGYFSLGLGKFSKAGKIIAIEKNPVAFRYLKQNIALNGINNIRPIRGDCCRLRIKEKADRVLMGYFPHTERFLPAAFKLLKPHAVIHYHNIYPEKDMRTKPVAELEQAAKRAGYKVVGVTHRIVKSYAPRVWHIVVDAEVMKEDGIKRFYDRTAEMYDLRQKNAWTERLRDAEVELLKKYASGRVLDIGCGTGFHLAWLANEAEGKILSLAGLDASKEMLEVARKSAPTAEFVEGNAERLPFGDDTFDTVLCMFSTLNLCNYQKALAEVFRVLKPDGKAILSVSSIWDNGGKPEKRIRIEKEVLRLHLFGADELDKEINKAGFKVISFDSLFRAARPRWGDWSSAVEDDLSQTVEKGAIYLYVLEK